MQDYGIHWFRRDLRLFGNTALDLQIKKFDGRVLGFFCFDKSFLSRDDFSVNRFQFFLETLAKLRETMRERGGDLLVMDVGPEVAFKQLFSTMDSAGISLPTLITWNRDYEPFAVARDTKMRKFFDDTKIEHKDFRDHLIIEPHELEKAANEGYQVYSPFAKKWLKIIQEDAFSERIKEAANSLSNSYRPTVRFNIDWSQVFKGNPVPEDHLDSYRADNIKSVTVDIPKPGFEAALEQLGRFKSVLSDYQTGRDFPAIDGTSRMSHYLKNGTVTTAQVIAFLNLKPYVKKQDSFDNYYSELIWREFYIHILSRHPRVEKEAFLVKYKKIAWVDRPDWLEAWKKGMTGYPIVDAGMRELLATGHMHNRVRMIVSSFLTKDLLINWQEGERYFMKELLDGDVAANNGGWQWAASTGCDPQPYFRIFNPWLQSKKFDADGAYIKTYIPELKNVPAKNLHAPIVGHDSYPEPIVDHKERRELALKAYKAAR